MADAHAPAKPDAAGAKKKPPILVIALVGLNLSALAAVGAYLFLMSGSEESAHHASADDADEEDDGEEADDEEEDDDEEERPLGPLVEFESLVVNLAASGADHYLKITFQLELRDPEALEHVETHMVPYRDRVLAYFGSLTVEEVSGAEQTAAVREHLMLIAREVFGRRMVRAIYFTELLVQ